MDEHERACELCRGTLRASASLRFKRLGNQERRQLLSAASPADEPSRIYPPGTSPSEQTATRRAVANLVAFGLIRLAPERVRLVPGHDDAELTRLGRKYAVVRQAWRTVLGDEIVQRYRRELEGGQRIRWMYHLDAATEAALDSCPRRLVTARKQRLRKMPMRLERAARRSGARPE
jgi:hypothetical protein